MKKLFTLLALTGMIVLSPACSDETAAWQELPTTPISGADATLTVNGVKADGSVTLTPSSATQGTLSLDNVFPGYEQIAVYVTLSERNDGSFDFSGSTTLSTPPAMMTRESASSTPILAISVSGNLTPAGKVSASVTSLLSDEAQGGLTGSWNLQNYMIANVNESTTDTAPLQLIWTPIDAAQPNMAYASNLISLFGSCAVAQLLKTVTFHADGNITANYWTELTMDDLFSYEESELEDGRSYVTFIISHEWLESPKNNLAFWYAMDGLIYIVPNIDAIMAQVGEDSGETPALEDFDITALIGTLTQYGVDITPLIPVVTQMLYTGIPLRYIISDGSLCLYVDKQMATPFMDLLMALTPMLDELLAQAAEEDENLAMLKNMLPFLFGIEKLSDMQSIWANNTDDFGIELNFSK